jgi:hypothetical protein
MSPTQTRSPQEAKQLARDVARNLEARRRKRKVVVILLVVALIVAAIMFFGFGGGFGFGKGKGKGAGPGSGTGAVAASPDAGPPRCMVRVTVEGIAVDGKTATQAEAVETCKARGAADVVVTGDARQGAWDDLEAAFEAAGVAVYQRGGAGSGTGSGSGSGR